MAVSLVRSNHTLITCASVGSNGENNLWLDHNPTWLSSNQGFSRPQYLICCFPSSPVIERYGGHNIIYYAVSYKTILGFMYLTKLFGMLYILHNYLYMFCISQNYLSVFCISYLEPCVFCKLSCCVLYHTQLS